MNTLALERLRKKAQTGKIKLKNRRKRDQSKYMREKYQTDPDFRLASNIRRRMRLALQGKVKKNNSLNLLGCSVQELKNHLQKTARDNGYLHFNINNYSGKEYHIDHIIPCNWFNLSCSFHQKLCFNYKNLQILSAGANLKKERRSLL